ncbi:MULTISPECIES: hypothetical protein [Ochrobactrum]|uniref:Uncharacterized protein n=1 Tax=Ochrobactrum chromiisoli TaxID=2993941 RepID=A0ABT3QT07_9HYPH|nr:hypothetical protein [Ochrobactrum chromiisoli]
MTPFDPLNAIIAKPEKPLPPAEGGRPKGERVAVKSISDVAGMPNGRRNRQILTESVARQSSDSTRFTQQLETIIGDNAARTLPTVPDADCTLSTHS